MKKIPCPDKFLNCATSSTVGTLFGKAPPPHGTARAGHEIPNSTGGTSDTFLAIAILLYSPTMKTLRCLGRPIKTKRSSITIKEMVTGLLKADVVLV